MFHILCSKTVIMFECFSGERDSGHYYLPLVCYSVFCQCQSLPWSSQREGLSWVANMFSIAEWSHYHFFQSTSSLNSFDKAELWKTFRKPRLIHLLSLGYYERLFQSGLDISKMIIYKRRLEAKQRRRERRAERRARREAKRAVMYCNRI